MPQAERLPSRDVCNLVALNNDTLLLYGGLNSSTVRNFSDLHVYSMTTGSWKELAVADPIASRHFASVGCCAGKIYLFGGYAISPEEQFLNDFYRIDVNLKDSTARYVPLDSPNRPPPRSAHGMIELSEKHLLVIGGEGDKEETE